MVMLRQMQRSRGYRDRDRARMRAFRTCVLSERFVSRHERREQTGCRRLTRFEVVDTPCDEFVRDAGKPGRFRAGFPPQLCPASRLLPVRPITRPSSEVKSKWA